MYFEAVMAKTLELLALFLFLLSSPAPYILSLGVLINFVFDIELIWCIFIATGFSTIYVWN